jgi:hypothetical protein
VFSIFKRNGSLEIGCKFQSDISQVLKIYPGSIH